MLRDALHDASLPVSALDQALADLAGGNAALREALAESLADAIREDAAAMFRAWRADDRPRLRACARRLGSLATIVRFAPLVAAAESVDGAAADAAGAAPLPGHLIHPLGSLAQALAATLLALRGDEGI